ncbi:polyprenyl synthetase family protein [Streptomyces sp. WI04-05B]|uniref:polyprenyl synthetase family protein n=1 Tax=Streptomyces TaxID=1883 RepID=UPI0029ABB1C0|nr:MULTISPECIES: polyprenyl synthetase family protein [unclassified Streptomyces]MDX2547300.1 polyprenyl synthetase family protein [Streptomyces sp. WI04-05B]MDX2589788.1 polyprenyl synthetase family protein [Streptomyces sp. WI04-05A]MDX3753474.1 polyprenyl synthetase family protein [Streptomyces sp. AK08-02]
MSTAPPVSQEFTDTDMTEILTARDDLLHRVEQRLRDFLDHERRVWESLNPDSTELIDCVADMVGSGGKRLRPAFCVAGYLAGGGDPRAEEIVDVAAALELLHSFALLHDDVMDDAELRRGAPTAQSTHAALHADRGWRGEARRYGESVAVLAGDLALVYAERLLAGCPQRVRPVWGELCTELMIGQFLDVRAAARFTPDAELSSWIALFKSGRYTVFRPLAMGARLAGADELVAPFETYGLAVGEAFQLRDDLLDAFGSATATGKPARLDLKQHKMTLLMSLALQTVPEVRELVDDELAATDPDELHDLLLRTGVRDRVESVIAERMAAAQDALRGTVRADWAEGLRRMAVQAVYRDH